MIKYTFTVTNGFREQEETLTCKAGTTHELAEKMMEATLNNAWKVVKLLSAQKI